MYINLSIILGFIAIADIYVAFRDYKERKGSPILEYIQTLLGGFLLGIALWGF